LLKAKDDQARGKKGVKVIESDDEDSEDENMTDNLKLPVANLGGRYGYISPK
jgi:hypothetical protein